MNEEIESIVLAMQQDLVRLNTVASAFLDAPEYHPELDNFIRGYYLSGEESMQFVLNYVEANPDFYEKTGDSFRENIRLMKSIREKIGLLEKKFHLR
ncbi:MAG: hypothetical protein MUF42_07005 [Cytophagaceae bacterium]|jgi:hypothetical protein|nr:hypothetical protein [Cytophagaceae bacterium]